MPGPDQLQGAVGPNFRLDGAHLIGKLGLGEDHVQLRQQLVVRLDLIPVLGGHGGQLRQDALDLRLLRQGQLPQGVVGVDGAHGLNEEGAAGGGHVVHQAGDGGLALRLDRHHVAVAPHGDDGLPQGLGVGGRRDDFVQGFLDLGALCPHFAADRSQLAAGGVGDLVLGEDGPGDAVLEVAVGHELVEQGIEDGVHVVAVAVGLDGAGAAQHPGDAQQLCGGQAAAPLGAQQLGAHVHGAPEAGGALGLHQLACAGGLGLGAAHVVRVRHGPQGQAASGGVGAAGAIGQQLQHPVQLQLGQ